MILHAREAGEGPPVALLHGLFGSARNLGTVQARLAARYRVLALDLRNHGDSPHASGMDYATMAEDVRETLAESGALPAALIGHSMGGKVAMRLALAAPNSVTRVLIADIAPVAYPPGFGAYAEAMAALPLHPGLTRPAADAALAPAIPEASVRPFLLQNLRLGAAPSWRIGLAEITAALPDIEGWNTPPGVSYGGPTLFVSGELSSYIQAEVRPLIRALFPAAKFVTLRHAGHWLHADNPDGFIAVADAFLGDRA